MAWLFGEKKFGQYTYEHWFDDEFNDVKTDSVEQYSASSGGPEKTNDSDDNTDPHTQPRQP